MKHEVTTFNTKKMFAASLKKFLEKKSFSKITVSEIITDCGVNRKTFYYHFEDINALLKWMLEQEAVDVVKKFDLLVDYEEAILFVLNYVDENKHILNCVYDSVGYSEMKRFLYADFIGLTRSVIDSVVLKLELNVDENFKVFLSHFYTESLAGLLSDELKGKSECSRDEVIQYISLILQVSVPDILIARSDEISHFPEKH